ncbi:PIN domain-like protein [Amniculicola lignicola CBS 123094]|uniref:PIN domain-like protein n=1 Tax=Amniculicola lignicola CBS 123094 TaxID=1392246 RepID=A0A6A5WU15_9PLEO|nr:PIN domain-like protein [Amniculicola lignicola CBS 123094]
MGISGLLPLLKSIHKPGSLKKYAGQTIGVDAYGWLHRGTASCAIELALDKPTTKVVDFAMSRVRMLVHFGITPYLVFDGDYLPSKSGTEKERAARRKEGRRLGLELLKVGKTSQAHLELQKAVDVTPEMARQLIEELKHHNIPYVVAPYEADSQLVYLERKGLINGILSEDSDLLVFGAKCLLTKLDKFGEVIEVNRNMFTACREISLAGWSDVDFRRMAMLSGCDYLPSPGGMGLKTAHRMLRKHKTVDRLIKAAQFDGKFKVPPRYLESFHQAEMTFLYQWVFCPVSKQVVNLTEPEDSVKVEEMSFLGERVEASIAMRVARGDLHPHTKEPIVVELKDRTHTKPLKPSSRRVSTNVQTPDSKHPKPIDSFFRPKRTPLAELDPNIFTPSPSQQVILEQQTNNGWAAVLAPQPQSQSHQRASLLRTAPQPARRVLSDTFGRRASAPHPSKRQRLCSERYDTPASTKDEGVRSRFFGSSVPEPSPSLRNANKSKQSPKSEFDLWDDLDEAMLERADSVEAASQPKKKKISIFKDDSAIAIQMDSQSTTASGNTSGGSQITAGTLTPASSLGNPEPDLEEETVFTPALNAEFKELRAKFSFGSSGPSQKPAAPAPTTPRKAPPKGLNKRSISGPTTSRLSGNRLSGFVAPLPSSKTATPNIAEDDSDMIADSVWKDDGAELLVARSPSKPVRSDIEVRGSEDLLIPDSEAESDCSPRKPMLNLGRFAFGG